MRMNLPICSLRLRAKITRPLSDIPWRGRGRAGKGRAGHAGDRQGGGGRNFEGNGKRKVAFLGLGPMFSVAEAAAEELGETLIVR